MGYYIEVPKKTQKALQLVKLHGAKMLSRRPGSFKEVPAGKALVCVVNNGLYEAACFCYSRQEFERLSANDGRPRKWLLMDLKLVIKLTAYRQIGE